jgi:hypothetical protein
MFAVILLEIASFGAPDDSATAREAWSVRHDEPAHAMEEGASIAADGAGNIYIAGASERSLSEETGVVTLEKRDPEGNLLWSVRADPFISPPEILRDPAGNLVLGCPEGIAKFDPDGRRLWLLPSSEPLREADLDPRGNILTLRLSWTSDPEATIEMFDPDGNPLWRRSYRAPWRHFDFVVMAVDRDGNVLLAWSSLVVDTWSVEYRIVKFDGAGEIVWEARFPGGFPDEDFVRTLATDGAGNIYLGGNVLLKCDPAGREVWRLQRGVEKIVPHESGDVFVLGYGLARVDPDGNVRWTRDPDEHGFGDFIVTPEGAVFAYAQGNGSIIKIDPQGIDLWETAIEGAPKFWESRQVLALDPEGNLFLSGVFDEQWGDTDRWTFKFGPDGLELWRVRQDEPVSGDEAAHGAVLSRDGALFVLADTFSNGWANDFLTVEFSLDGKKLWAVRHPFPFQEFPSAIAVGPDGNVVVSGYSENDLLTLKYDARTGRRLWEAREPGSGSMVGSCMSVDTGGNVWVSGVQDGLPGPGINTTVKYDPDGGKLWLLRHGRNPTARIAAHPSGGAILVLAGRDISYLVRLSPDGRELWETRLMAGGWDLAIDGEGFLYLAGAWDPDGDGSDLWLTKFEPEVGGRVWDARYAGAGGKCSSASVVVDREGNSYLCGTSQGLGPFPEYAVAKHDRDGKRVWDAVIPSAGRIEWPRIALDREGGLVLCGYMDPEGGDPWSSERRLGLEVFRLSPRGELLWKVDRPGPETRGHRSNQAPLPFIDDSGRVFIAGTLYTPETDNDIEVIGYPPAPIPFVRGDCDADGKVSGTVSDPLFLLLHLFADGSSPICPAACDANGDGGHNLADAVYLLLFDFLGGAPPPLPFPACGYDGDTGLRCEVYPGC